MLLHIVRDASSPTLETKGKKRGRKDACRLPQVGCLATEVAAFTASYRLKPGFTGASNYVSRPECCCLRVCVGRTSFLRASATPISMSLICLLDGVQKQPLNLELRHDPALWPHKAPRRPCGSRSSHFRSRCLVYARCQDQQVAFAVQWHKLLGCL
jgi:hypothetical protein